MKVVEYHQRASEYEDGVRSSETIFRAVGKLLDEPHHVVAEVSDRSAPELAELWNVRGLGSLDEQAQISERVGGRPCIVPPELAGPVFHDAVREPPRGAWLGPQIGVTGPRLAPRGRGLEKKRERAAPELGERRDRCVGVEKTILPHGHERGRSRFPLEILEAHCLTVVFAAAIVLPPARPATNFPS